MLSNIKASSFHHLRQFDLGMYYHRGSHRNYSVFLCESLALEVSSKYATESQQEIILVELCGSWCVLLEDCFFVMI